METEDSYGPPRGPLLGLGLTGLVLAAAIAGVFVFRLQPQITSCLTPAAGQASVCIPANASVTSFSPINITVILGVNSTIMWTNQDTISHTVVVCPVGGGQVCPSSSAIARSVLLSHGDTFTVALNATGTYHYYCSIHPATMRAAITVKAGTKTTP